MEYYWSPFPSGLLKGVGTRSFDNLPEKVKPNFKELYGRRLVWPKESVD